MKKILISLILSFLMFFSSAFGEVLEFKNSEAKLAILFEKIPIFFIENKGQLNDNVQYYNNGHFRNIFFTKEGIYISLHRTDRSNDKLTVIPEYVFIKPVGAKKIDIIGEDVLLGKTHYFIGNNSERWIKEIPIYSKVKYKRIYDGIDIVFYGNQKFLEYDIIVDPGADPSWVAFQVEGAKELKNTEKGDLEIIFESGMSIIQKKPYIYQVIEGQKFEVKGNYVIKKENNNYIYSFKIENYDKNYTLIIDPILSYSTYIGGSGAEGESVFPHFFSKIAVDSFGNAYIAGLTYSSDFPIKNAFQNINKGYSDIFVLKIDTNKSGQDSLVYSTYLGGNYYEYFGGIAIDAQGNAYVTGGTYSSDFPTKGITGCNAGWVDAFITKLSSSGDLVYSRCFGGDSFDVGYAIAVDAQGNAYVTGRTNSNNFPKLYEYQGYQGMTDIFITKFDQFGNILYSTYLGGSNNEYGLDIAVDNQGNAFITGTTYSTNFPVKNAFQVNNNGQWDVFVAKVDTTKSGLNSLIYSTYLGGDKDDYGYGIAIDTSGNTYITGNTKSTNFPIKNEYQRYQAFTDSFVTKLNSSGNDLIYSTYLGGNNDDFGYDIALDSLGNAYIVGATSSSNFPLKSEYQQFQGGTDAFVTKLSSLGNSLIYSTYLGGSSYDSGYGIAIDNNRNIYVTGETGSDNFPIKNAFQSNRAGLGDAFLTKLSEGQVFLKLLKPNGGEKWNAGSKYVIKWEAPLNSYKFNLRYSVDNKATWTNIATVLASNRCTSDGTKYTCTYGWTIPAQDGRKPQSFVRVVALNSSNQTIGTDDSDKAFVIEVLRVTSPNGGETLKAGSTHTITWQTYALTKTVAKVQLQYSTNGGQSWTNIKTITGNPGQYSWTVPNTTSTNCKVRVILKDSAGAEIARDVSDRVFTIQQ